jgi:subtilisin family serine protease
VHFNQFSNPDHIAAENTIPIFSFFPEEVRMKKVIFFTGMMVVLLLSSFAPVSADSNNQSIGINVLLNTGITDEILGTLGGYGKVLDQIPAIDALTMKVKAGELPEIQALPFVAAANPDAERKAAPIDTVVAEDYTDGLSTWNLDAIDVTDWWFDNRQVSETGDGVYVAVLDTGLVSSWRQYFPEERIAEEYAKSFGGGGGLEGNVSEQPNKWEHDTNSHGTHVTSTIIGYSFGVNPVNGVAPLATIIPVKVLNQSGGGWSSVIAHGITYVADLKAGPLADSPVVINMSLGGSMLDAVEKEAIDYAVSQGVIIVASAGNEGTAGMGYPGAYAPVISVGAVGWAGEWYPDAGSAWWYRMDVGEPTDIDEFYVADFSSRELPDQDLDVLAPGSWIVGPYNPNQGQISYYFLGGTSMASPHVAGLVALMAEKAPGLTAPEAETILETSAIPMGAGAMYDPYYYNLAGTLVLLEWGTDATGSGLVNAPAALGLLP